MKQVMGNVIVGQSGGPTAVINSSLAGVFKTAKTGEQKGIWYAARHSGIVRGTGG